MSEPVKSRIDEAFARGIDIDRALARAVREALLTHKKLGHSVVEWRDGKVVWVPPEEIEVPEEPEGGQPET